MKEKLARMWKKAGGLPGVDLEEGENVEVVVRRSKAGLILILLGEVVGFVLLSVVLMFVARGEGDMLTMLNSTAMGYLYLLIFMMYLVLMLVGGVGVMVYRANFLVVTNKRVVQITTASLFARSINVIELTAVEDVSFAQKNVFDRVFKVGTVRLATVGDETTYTLNYVDSAETEVKKIIKLLYAAKERKTHRGGVDKKA